MHCFIYIDLPLDLPSLVWWYSWHLCSIAREVKWYIGIYALFYIYIYLPLDCAKFGVVVIMASMLDCKGGQTLVIGICALFYIYRYLPLDCAKFGVVGFKASMFDWRGGTLAIGICALFYIYRSAIRLVP